MVAYILILAGFFMRLVPHVPNFAPVTAIAIFSGAYLKKNITPWVPLAIMVASDLIIGLHDVVLYTWGAFIVISFAGRYIKTRKNPLNIFGVTAFSSIFFFIVTNFGVWITWYPHTWTGLADCYVKALPFFRNTFSGDIVYVFVFFGTYEAVRKLAKDTRFNMLVHSS